MTVRTCLMNNDLFPLWRAPGEESSSLPGINIELHEAIAEELGFVIEWVRAPFPRCLVLLRNHEVDMFNVASYRADREKYGKYPTRDGDIDHARRLKSDTYEAFVIDKGAVDWNGDAFTVHDRLPVAIEIGASIRSWLNERNTRVYEVSRPQQAFDMLARGRVAAVITNQFNGIPYLDKGVTQLMPSISEKSYFIMIADEFYEHHPLLSEQVWDVSKIVRERIYGQLLVKYSNLNGWPPLSPTAN
ncbi:substrate-binding periplasmic protein [Aestuariibacter salexigens]|uniref:substrate-binding periplasmic protein n=1 Tax=Aestuariibacter salexigens TaxID=226010 RepID=UPI0004138D54|nr:transporter substrate-binding domain-containing protein [Aestuariibacter salexigens]